MPSRQLSAIMFIDIVGYTALMQASEKEGIKKVGQYRSIVEHLLIEYDGELLQHQGDGSLCIFRSSVGALKCAERIQHQVQQNTSLNIRIGVHVGDIVKDGNDYFGDGINIASRLESLGEAGSILFTERVYFDIQSHPDLLTKYIGEYQFKNDNNPHHVYALANQGLTIPAPIIGSGKAKLVRNKTGRKISRWSYGIAGGLIIAILALYILRPNGYEGKKGPTSIAILPLINESQDPGLDYLCEGIPENLIDKLSGIPDLRVISKQSISVLSNLVAYPIEIGKRLNTSQVLAGSLNKLGDQVEVHVELVNSSDNSQIWGREFKKHEDEILQMENEILESLSQILEPVIPDSLFSRISKGPETTSPQAFQLYLQGKFLIQKSNPEEINKGLALLREAISIDRKFAKAYAAIADAMYMQAYFSAAKRSEIVGEGLTAGNSALALNPLLAEAHTAIAEMKFYFEFDHRGAEKAFLKALELNPNESTTCIRYSNFLLTQCRFDEALAYAQKALETDPISISALHGVGIAYYLMDDYSSAAENFDKALDIHPNWIWGQIKSGLAHALSDNCDRALSLSNRVDEQIIGWGSAKMQAWLARTYYLCGKQDLYQRAYNRIMDGLEKGIVEDPFSVAELYTVTEDIEKILEWFYRAYDVKSPSLSFLPIYQCMEEIPESFKTDPRYLELMRKVFETSK